jgi:hypothetical protein
MCSTGKWGLSSDEGIKKKFLSCQAAVYIWPLGWGKEYLLSQIPKNYICQRSDKFNSVILFS